jgi:hypothetical protein
MRTGRPTGGGLTLYPRFDSPAMAFETNDWISSGVNATGFNAATEAAATAGSSITVCGGRLVFIGGDMNTGWCEAGLVERMREIGLDGSLEGVTLGVMLMAEMEEVEWLW